MPKIAAVVGSLRGSSLNLQLAQTAASCLGSRAELSMTDYHDIPLFNEDIEHPAPTAVARIRQEVLDADGIWFFTAEYNHGIPGVLKNLIDWLSRPIDAQHPQVLLGKPAALSGISLGAGGTVCAQDQMVVLISFLQMRLMNAPRLTIPNASSQMEGPVLKLDASLPYLKRQAEAFLEFLA